ncbi:MAG TPA: hypothetical protein VL524_13965 [Gemmatimonadaceae bacterium]|jgi:hypothetical protein|nr:hypothetical protein [Gemmatimonadaceae bacterium]
MPDSPVPRPPAPRLDRAALERVLARAAELQGKSGDSGDQPEEFTEEQLIELGKEVGLTPQVLRQAVAEERTRSVLPDDEHGVGAALFGPSRVSAVRTVDGRPSDALATIDAWMQRQELLIVKRHHADRIVWEPRRDFLVGLKRALRAGGRDYALSRAFEVAATVIAVDDARVHVALEADFRTQRRVALSQTTTGAVVGAAATASLLVIGAMPLIAIVPVIVGPALGYSGARVVNGHIITRAQLALEQLLDRLERGEYTRRGGAESLLGAIAAAAATIPPRRF